MIKITYTINTENIDKDGFGDIVIEKLTEPNATNNDCTDTNEFIARMSIEESANKAIKKFYKIFYGGRFRPIKRLIKKSNKYFDKICKEDSNQFIDKSK